MIIILDDFEKEYPDFDWKNTPAYKHPGGKDCPCPKHEYIREQINFTKQVNVKSKEAILVNNLYLSGIAGITSSMYTL